MRLSRLLLLGSLAFLPVVQAADEIAEPVCEEKTWSDGSTSATGIRFSLEQMREFQVAFQSFRRPQTVDPSETVIRVYDADGNYEERKIRFSALPRNVVLDARRRSERTVSYAETGESVEAASQAAFASGGIDPRSFLPIGVAGNLTGSGPCQ
jgi:hypothetical protein